MTTLAEFRAARRATFDTHSDTVAGDQHLAVNVKYYGPFPESDDETILDGAWRHAVDEFWQDAAVIARQHGYNGVTAEGRSGGWLLPYQTDITDRPSSYGSPDDLEDRVMFLPFEAAIKARLAQTEARLADAVRNLAKLAQDNLNLELSGKMIVALPTSAVVEMFRTCEYIERDLKINNTSAALARVQGLRQLIFRLAPRACDQASWTTTGQQQ